MTKNEAWFSKETDDSLFSSSNGENSGLSLHSTSLNSASIDKEKTFNKVIDNTLRRVPDIYLHQSVEILNGQVVVDKKTAEDKIFEALGVKNACYKYIGVCAYKVWSETSALTGGAGKKALEGEGKLNALNDLAKSVTFKGRKITYQTLYKYVRYIDVFVEKPLKKLKTQNKKTIRHKRIVFLKRLFSLPQDVCSVAVKAEKPYECFKNVYFRRVLKGDKSLTSKKLSKELARLKGPIKSASKETLDDIEISQVTPAEPSEVLYQQNSFSDFLKKEAKKRKMEVEELSGVLISFQEFILNSMLNFKNKQ